MWNSAAAMQPLWPVTQCVPHSSPTITKRPRSPPVRTARPAAPHLEETVLDEDARVNPKP